jgi:hypothetical protein
MSLQRGASLHRSGTRRGATGAAAVAAGAAAAPPKPKKGFENVKQGIKVLYPEDESKKTDTE